MVAIKPSWPHRPSPIMIPNSFHPIFYTRQLKPIILYRILYSVVHKSDAPSARSEALGPAIYPSPRNSETKLQSNTALPLLPLHRCSFPQFACMATSVHSDSSPCSCSTPPLHGRQYQLFLFVSLAALLHFLLHNRRHHHSDLLPIVREFRDNVFV